MRCFSSGLLQHSTVLWNPQRNHVVTSKYISISCNCLLYLCCGELQWLISLWILYWLQMYGGFSKYDSLCYMVSSQQGHLLHLFSSASFELSFVHIRLTLEIKLIQLKCQKIRLNLVSVSNSVVFSFSMLCRTELVYVNSWIHLADQSNLQHQVIP